MRSPDENPFSHLTPFQCDMLLATHLLSKDKGHNTKEWEVQLLKAIARLLIQIAAETKHRGHAYFFMMLARLFDPELSADRIADYPEFFRAVRRKVKLVMTTKGHPKDHHIDDDAIPRTTRGTLKAEVLAQLLGVSERQAYRIKASKKRGHKRS
jgi:hypothetical protein